MYSPGKLAVIGVSPKPFGHFAYGSDYADAMSYLGSHSNFERRLNGSELLNSMHERLVLLKAVYPEQLGSIRVDRGFTFADRLPTGFSTTVTATLHLEASGASRPKCLLGTGPA